MEKTDQTTAMKWHESHDNLCGLARWMESEDLWLNTGELVYFLEKPWKWTREFELWQLWQTQADVDRQQEIVVAVIEEVSASTIQARWEEE